MQEPEFPEVGGIVHLEHVNFLAPDPELAMAFFMGGLGFTRDPYKRISDTNMGVNVGMQQFHLPNRGTGTPLFPGVVGIIVPDIAGIKSRLSRLESMGRFEGTPFALVDVEDGLRIISPFGVALRLHSSGTIPGLHSLGISYVDTWIPEGNAQRIVAFYRSVFNCPAEVTIIDGETTALITVGPYQTLRYRERVVDNYNTYNFHVAIYVTHYNEIHTRLSELDSQIGNALDQIYFCNGVFDIESGAKLSTLQHEIRGVYHPDFMRPLVNRWPLGDEALFD